MREITTHHDGHGLNEALSVTADGEGPGGAAHHYKIYAATAEGLVPVLDVKFQLGPRDEPGSNPGATTAALLAIVKDHIEGFQSGPYACAENAEALNQINAAMDTIRRRADERASRGVLGTYAK